MKPSIPLPDDFSSSDLLSDEKASANNETAEPDRMDRDVSERELPTDDMARQMEQFAGFVNDRMLNEVGREEIPSRIGDFTVIERLETGGQSHALLARDEQLQREVVIKYYHSATTPGHHRQIIDEGRALACIESDRIVKCLSVGSHEGVPYLVLEYVKGQPLSTLTARFDKDMARTLSVVRQIAEGIKVVHAKGIIHGDLKPQNILISDCGTPKIVDFGLAKRFDDPTNSLSGTISYLAPEKARGETHHISPTTDVFGLGAILYDLLTGQAPFPSNVKLDALIKAKEGIYTKPTDINARIPKDIERLCETCLHSDPNQRFTSVDELIAAIKKIRRPVPRWQVAVPVSMVLVLATLFAVWLVNRSKSTESSLPSSVDKVTPVFPDDLIRLPFKNEMDFRIKVNNVVLDQQNNRLVAEPGSITLQMSCSQYCYVAVYGFVFDQGQDRPMVKRLFPADREEAIDIVFDPEEDTELRITCIDFHPKPGRRDFLYVVASNARWDPVKRTLPPFGAITKAYPFLDTTRIQVPRDIDRKRKLYECLIQLTADTAPKIQLDETDASLLKKARAAESAGDWEAARQHHETREQLAKQRSNVIKDRPWLLADIKYDLQRASKRSRLSPSQLEALAEADKQHKMLDREMMIRLNQIDAVAIGKEVWETRKSILGEEDIETIDALFLYGRARATFALDREFSKQAMDTCLQRYREYFGAQHKKVGEALYYAAHVQAQFFGDYVAAEQLLRDALRIAENLSAVSPRSEAIRIWLASALIQLGKWSEARDYLDAVIERCRGKPLKYVPALSTALRTKADLLIMQSDYWGALAVLEEAQKVLVTHRINATVAAIPLKVMCANVYSAVGLHDKAIRYIQSALENLENSVGRTSALVPQALQLASQIYLEAGDLENAERYLQRSSEYIQKLDSPLFHRNCIFRGGQIRYWQGDFRSAETAFRKALELPGTPNMLQADYHFWLGRALAAQNKVEAAFDHFAQAIEIGGRFTESVLQSTSETAAQRYVSRMWSYVCGLVEEATDESNPSRAYEMVWKIKGTASRNFAYRRNWLMGDANSAIRREHRNIRDQIVALSLKSSPDANRIERLIRRKDQLEIEMAKQIPWLRRFHNQPEITVDKLAPLLGPEVALVDFVKTIRTIYDKETRTYKHVAHFHCFVISSDRQGRPVIQWKRLPGITDLDRQIRKAQDQVTLSDDLRSGNRRNSAQGSSVSPEQRLELYDAVWKPIERCFRDGQHIVIIPDGRLAEIPFCALPASSGDTSERLIQRYTISYADYGQQVYLWNQGQKVIKARSMLAIGGPDFGEPEVNVDTDNDDRQPWSPLEHAAAEARQVSSYWNTHGYPVRSLTGASATRKNFLDLYPSFSILHLATHAESINDSSLMNVTPREYELSAPVGLAFAGANQHRRRDPLDTTQNAFLDSNQIASQDFRCAWLVVLSACQSSIGYRAVGEGSFGLNRVFCDAGAQSVISSRVKIDDLHARRFMEAFYENLSETENKAVALQKTQIQMMDELPLESWSSFTLYGSWTP